VNSLGEHAALKFGVKFSERFESTVEYLSRVRRRKTVWKKSTSYGWKHQAEHYLTGLRDGNPYALCNGVFIIAAIELGFVVERIPGSPRQASAIPGRQTAGS
jgi:hypothetical protein